MSARSRTEPSAPAGREGYTLIEVMISLLVFMVAVLGLVALQKASVAGTYKGREHTAAVNIARYVLTQLQNEAAIWPLAEEEVSQARFPLLFAGLASEGSWNLLANDVGPVSPSFRLDAYLEHSGRDFYSEVDSAPYCVHYMVERAGSEARPEDLLRLRVRVVWPRWGQYAIEGDGPTAWKSCNWTGYNLSSGISDRLRYSDSVELSGVVTREFTGQMPL